MANEVDPAATYARLTDLHKRMTALEIEAKENYMMAGLEHWPDIHVFETRVSYFHGVNRGIFEAMKIVSEDLLYNQ